jgi:flagellar assembly protein FliH
MTDAAARGFAPSFRPATPEQGFQPLWDGSAEGGGFRQLSSFEDSPAIAHAPSPSPTAEETLRQAGEQAVQIIAEAKARAAVDAEAQITAAVASERQTQVEAFQAAAKQLLDAVQEQSAARLEQIEREAAGLIVSLARRILHEHFTADEAAIVPVVREALRSLADAERVQVVIAPQHQPALRAAHEELARILRDSAQLEIVSAENAEPFGCLVHGPESSVDARLETRLQAVERAVDDTLDSAAAA